MCFSTRCRSKSFQQERESTVVLLISYYSVQPDKNSFALSLNHTTFVIWGREISLVTWQPAQLISVCTGFANHIPSTLRSSFKKYSVWQSIVRINYILKRFLILIIKWKITLRTNGREKIDLSCRAAGDNIFLEVKVVLKTYKYCFLKAFLNGLVSQILNNNITDFT